MSWLKLGKQLIKGTADVAFDAASFVGKHQGTIADATRKAITRTGDALAAAGSHTEKAGKQGASKLHRKAGKAEQPLQRGSARAAAWTATGVAQLGRILRASGQLTAKAGPSVGAATGGFVLGGASITSEILDSVALSRNDIDALREELSEYGEQLQRESDTLQRRIASAAKGRRRAQMLDLLVVGGISLGFAVNHPNKVPAEVEQAFALAYPNLAANEGFVDMVNRLTSEQLPGFVSGVKGKLFEVELVEHFNNGGLPEGLHADLAGSAIQPGWDIRILDDGGQVVDVLQAKATESVHYIQQALERYPGIDVVSTSEVHAQLLALGLAEGVSNSGITEASLQAVVEQASDGAQIGFSASDLVPSALGLAVISLSLLLDRNMSWTERATELGARSARVGAAGAAAKIAMVATQTWWIGLVAGVGSHCLAAKGKAHREQYQALLESVAILRERHADDGDDVLLLTHRR